LNTEDLETNVLFLFMEVGLVLVQTMPFLEDSKVNAMALTYRPSDQTF
jgi:hypothetical protein